MGFYRSRYGYTDAAPIIQKFKDFLAKYAKALVNDEDPNRNWFFYGYDIAPNHREIFNKYFPFLQAGGFVKTAPAENGIFIIFSESADGPTPTVSPTHVRLPKLSHLITLIPEDFFILMRLISTAKTTTTSDALILNLGGSGIDNLADSTLGQFFTLLKKNYRINVDYADRKWTERTIIARIANLEPTQLNQLYAMQYLTFSLNKDDLLYFPIETAIELEVEFEQISNEYCIPKLSM